MTIYANKNGSYDGLNKNRMLFHLENGTCKLIGRVNDKWRHNYKAVRSLPREYTRFLSYMETYEIGKKM